MVFYSRRLELAFYRYETSAQFELMVELVEQGRGVFWSQLICLRSSLDDVKASGEEGSNLQPGLQSYPLRFVLCSRLPRMLSLDTTRHAVITLNCRVSSPIFASCLACLAFFSRHSSQSSGSQLKVDRLPS